MKRIVAFLLCVLLIGSVAGEVQWVRAASNPIEISGYSVSGVLGVADVYAVTLNLKYNSSSINPSAKLLDVHLISSDSNYAQAIPSGSRYIISNEPLEADPGTVSRLNSQGSASQTFYFLKTGK